MQIKAHKNDQKNGKKEMEETYINAVDWQLSCHYIISQFTTT